MRVRCEDPCAARVSWPDCGGEGVASRSTPSGPVMGVLASSPSPQNRGQQRNTAAHL